MAVNACFYLYCLKGRVMLINDINARNARKLHQRELWRRCRRCFSALMPANKVIGFGGVMRKTFAVTLLPRCMECRRGLAMRFLSVRPSVRLSNACIVTKPKKNWSRFLYHAIDNLV